MSTLIEALAIGSAYGLVAIAYNVIYTTTHVFNFAQGAIVAVASLVAYTALINWGLPTLVVLGMIGVAGMALALIEYVVAVRPVISRQRVTEVWLVSTFGASVLIEAAAALIWGPDPVRVPISTLDHLVQVGDGKVAVASFVAIGAALVATVGIDLWYGHTRTGKVLRAAAEDRDAAEVRGIDTRRVAWLSFALGGLIAGLAALVLVPMTFARPDLGGLLAIKAFVAMAIGGFGSNRGALIGGCAVGLVETYSAVWVGVNYQDALVFAMLLMVLLIMPRGLFGAPARRLV